MAKKENELLVGEAPDQKKIKVETPSIDFPVDVIATESDPYHETGAKFQAGSKKAKELVARGWVKMAVLVIGLFMSFASMAQKDLYNSLGSGLKTDTVTNAGVATVTTRALPDRAFSSVTIWITLTKISGTVAGTITLQGSADGVTWKALNTNDSQTALATVTATDVASNTFHWRLSGGAFPYYRVSWTGAGTMAATLAGKIFRN